MRAIRKATVVVLKCTEHALEPLLQESDYMFRPKGWQSSQSLLYHATIEAFAKGIELAICPSNMPLAPCGRELSVSW